MSDQIKSRERVADHGEVFTADREVNAMLDLVKQETERVDSRFLEPACGDGNFLAEILRRKLIAARKRATPPRRKKPIPIEFERQSVIAVTSVYGVDLLKDNVLACRERLYRIWNAEYEAVCQNEVDEKCREAVKFILDRNIVCGNALTLKVVDEKGEDADEPIVFSEWSFISGSTIQRKDYRFDKLLAGEYEPSAERKPREPETNDQRNLFDLLEEQPCDEGEFLSSYVADYRRIQGHGE
ncbi:MAG: hypothetical protein J6X44_08940 [Thermoguttaceae bacterium]|nr:hypothetical protein [Thermoguttaceae bacterium]